MHTVHVNVSWILTDIAASVPWSDNIQRHLIYSNWRYTVIGNIHNRKNVFQKHIEQMHALQKALYLCGVKLQQHNQYFPASLAKQVPVYFCLLYSFMVHRRTKTIIWGRIHTCNLSICWLNEVGVGDQEGMYTVQGGSLQNIWRIKHIKEQFNVHSHESLHINGLWSACQST